jgi:uncharacterized protein
VTIPNVPRFAWDTSRGARLRVHVQPRASRSAIVGQHGNALKVLLTTAPVDGQANRALMALVCERLDIRSSAVHIVTGLSSRTKVLEIAGVSAITLTKLGEI